MKIRSTSLVEKILTIDERYIPSIFGEYDSYIKKIEAQLHTSVLLREGSLKIIGEEVFVDMTIRVLDDLIGIARQGRSISLQQVNYAISLALENSTYRMEDIDKDIVCYSVDGTPIKVKTLGQKSYVEAINKNMIVFGIGPAGTGKTYLAMAKAIDAFKKDEVQRIILTRPAIEAGEKLGFLPGDLQSKVDPYLRPLYDALYQIMGAESFSKNMEKGLIEVAPLAYMRGRTLDKAFIILDEAQNTTSAQMKMFLTRIGFGSKVIVTGDLTQKDLPSGTTSGLEVATKVLQRVKGIEFCKLTNKDVVRHPLVQKIVEAYELFEGRQDRKSREKK